MDSGMSTALICPLSRATAEVAFLKRVLQRQGVNLLILCVFSRSEPLGRVATLFLLKLSCALGFAVCATKGLFTPLRQQTKTMAFLSEVQSHSPEWRRRGGENGGSPSTRSTSRPIIYHLSFHDGAPRMR